MEELPASPGVEEEEHEACVRCIGVCVGGDAAEQLVEADLPGKRDMFWQQRSECPCRGGVGRRAKQRRRWRTCRVDSPDRAAPEQAAQGNADGGVQGDVATDSTAGAAVDVVEVGFSQCPRLVSWARDIGQRGAVLRDARSPQVGECSGQASVGQIDGA